MTQRKPFVPAARMRHTLLAALALTTLSACQQGQDATKLPPATGEGAPAAKAIPTLADVAKTSPIREDAVTQRAGTGSLRPLHQAALGPKQTGVLSAILVDEGDAVKKGQLLFRQDTAQAALNIDQARAAVSSAKIQLAQAQLDLDRTKALRERGSIPQDALDQAKTRVDALSSTVTQAETGLSLAQKYSGDLAVTSPIDGVVASKLMNVGETATLMPPSVVLVIQQVDILELRARLPEASLRTVHVGHELHVRFPAIDETREATIKRIAPTIDARTRTIEIIAELPNPDGKLLAGMLAEVSYGPEDGKTAAAAAATATATGVSAAAAGVSAAAEKAGTDAPR